MLTSLKSNILRGSAGEINPILLYRLSYDL